MDDDAADAKPQIWVGTVDCKDAREDQLERILRQNGIEGTVRLFPLAAIPRGANGKVQRAQLKSFMLAVAGQSG
jgi:hypothetical protein